MEQLGLRCEICKHYEKFNLKQHLFSKHGITTKEYKKQYPLSKTMTGHSKRTLEYWTYRGYTVEEGKEQVKIFQQSGKKRFVEKYCENGHSVEEANSKWIEKQRKASLRCLDSYLSKGLTKDQAKEERAKIQATYSSRSTKFKGHSHTVKSKTQISEKIKEFITKEGIHKRVSHFHKGQEGNRSKGEIKCFLEIKELFPKLVANATIGSKIVDMVLDKVVIEFHGDFWHRNPKIYSPESEYKGIKTINVWEKDRKREEELRRHGYDVYIVWESDWNKHKELEKEKIKKYINENTN